jgi:hypothetical protein
MDLMSFVARLDKNSLSAGPLIFIGLFGGVTTPFSATITLINFSIKPPELVEQRPKIGVLSHWITILLLLAGGVRSPLIGDRLFIEVHRVCLQRGPEFSKLEVCGAGLVLG